MKNGFGGIVTLRAEGRLDEARRFLERCRIFTLAESLGGVESLVDHPGIMTHASVPPEQRQALGIDDALMRLSVGIEDIEDLMADLRTRCRAKQPRLLFSFSSAASLHPPVLAQRVAQHVFDLRVQAAQLVLGPALQRRRARRC